MDEVSSAVAYTKVHTHTVACILIQHAFLHAAVRPPCLLMVTLALLWAAEAATDGDFVCGGADGNGTQRIPTARFNDDFCDCEDGSDEPGTSACSGVGAGVPTFVCKNAGFESRLLFASRVNDGICDCCDGSDEFGTGSPACESLCHKHALAGLQRDRARLQALEAGLAKRADMEREARSSLHVAGLQLKYKREELQKAKSTLQVLKRALKREKSRNRLRRPKHVLPPAVDAIDRLTAPDQRLYAAVHDYLALHGGECGEEGEGGGGGRWPDNKKLVAFLSKALPGVNWGAPYTRSLVGQAVAAWQVERSCSPWTALLEDSPGSMAKTGGAERDGGVASAGHEEINPKAAATESHARQDAEDAPAQLLDDGAEGSEGAGEDEEEDVEEEVVAGAATMEGDARKFLGTMYEALIGWWARPLLLQVQPKSKQAELQSAVVQAKNEVRALKRRVQELERDLERDYGPSDVFHPLYRECLQASLNGYTYRVCPFQSAEQVESGGGGRRFSLGRYDGWRREPLSEGRGGAGSLSEDRIVFKVGQDTNAGTDESGAARRAQEGYAISQAFRDGAPCPGAGARKCDVVFECGREAHVLSVEEVATCSYRLAFATPAACRESEVSAPAPPVSRLSGRANPSVLDIWV